LVVGGWNSAIKRFTPKSARTRLQVPFEPLVEGVVLMLDKWDRIAYNRLW